MAATSTAYGKTHVLKPLCILVAISFKVIFANTQGPCKDKEVWTNCLHNVCGAKTCDDLGYIQKCSIDLTAKCVGGCICLDQYLRNSENQCVPIEECPSCVGDFNATAGSGTHCGNLCSNYKQPYVFCLEKPIEHMCECKTGYVFNDRIGKCILPEDCPKPCRGDHYAEEKVCAASNQLTCVKPHEVKSNKCLPAGSCECIFPYVLHKSGGKCVRFDTCPGKYSLEDFFPTEAPTTTSTDLPPTSSSQAVLTAGLTDPELWTLIKYGSRVVRGKDWSHGDEDGGIGSQGTVIREPLSGFVRVKWDNGKVNSYRMGDGNDYELDLAEHRVVHMPGPTNSNTAKPQPLISRTGPELASLMTLDTRVVRGKDWAFGDEDGGQGSEGTVVLELSDGMVRVEWDSGKTNSYNMGRDGRYELDLARTEKSAATISNLSGNQLVALMKKDDRVVRGRDWEYGDQDGGEGNLGTVLNDPTDGWVRVEWDTGGTDSYKMGKDNKFELDLA